MKQRIEQIIYYVKNFIFYFLSFLVIKNKKIWLFGSWTGQSYSDQSKYLFEYVKKNHPEIKAIWITKSKIVYEQLKNRQNEVYLAYSIPALWYSMRAKVLFVTQSIADDLHHFNNNKGIYRVQLYHGSSFKKVLYDATSSRQSDQYQKINKLKNLFFPFYIEKYDMLIAGSKEDRENVSTAFRISKDKIKLVGFPRNDILFSQRGDNEYKRILYAPTLRRDNNNGVLDVFNNDDLSVVEKMLHKIKCKLYIKLHPYNIPKGHLLESINNAKNIVLVTQGSDIQEALVACDILITDYSSSWVDFLLTDRPIIFAPFDYDNYLIEDRTFYYDYDETTPGPKVRNWSEAMEWIEAFLNNPSLYAQERKIIKNRFHAYQDAHSCERVYNTVMEELNVKKIK